MGNLLYPLVRLIRSQSATSFPGSLISYYPGREVGQRAQNHYERIAAAKKAR